MAQASLQVSLLGRLLGGGFSSSGSAVDQPGLPQHLQEGVVCWPSIISIFDFAHFHSDDCVERAVVCGRNQRYFS
jgi:hypothetical protein